MLPLPRRPDVIGHQCLLRPDEVEEKEGVYLTTRARTWLDLAELLGRHKKKRGIVRAREALDLSRVGSDSAQETRLRLAIINAGLPEPVLNQRIVAEWGDTFHEPDMSYPEYRLAIEYDGDGHSGAGQVNLDIGREEKIDLAGWKQVRISAPDMRNEAKKAVAKIRTALYRQGWRPAS